MNQTLKIDRQNLISKDGELYLYENFLSDELANTCLAQLLHNTPWQQRQITIFGNTVDQPRLISWHAESHIHYSYSGIDLSPEPWSDVLLAIKDTVESKINNNFNSAFLNLYRDGKDYMGWHRDNEKKLGPQPLIASISLGIKRKFKLKHMNDSDLKLDLELTSGSLLVMAGEIQHYWKHCLPKALTIDEPRINITFRQVYI